MVRIFVFDFPQDFRTISDILPQDLRQFCASLPVLHAGPAVGLQLLFDLLVILHILLRRVHIVPHITSMFLDALSGFVEQGSQRKAFEVRMHMEKKGDMKEHISSLLIGNGACIGIDRVEGKIQAIHDQVKDRE